MLLVLQKVYNKTLKQYTKLKDIGNVYQLKQKINKGEDCVLKRLGGEKIALKKVKLVIEKGDRLSIFSPHCIYIFKIIKLNKGENNGKSLLVG